MSENLSSAAVVIGALRVNTIILVTFYSFEKKICFHYMLKILTLLTVGILIMVIGKEWYEYCIIIYNATVEIGPLRNIECLTRW